MVLSTRISFLGEFSIKKPHSAIFSGESGSGKTTNLFHFMRYLSTSDPRSTIKIEHVSAVNSYLALFRSMP